MQHDMDGYFAHLYVSMSMHPYLLVYMYVCPYVCWYIDMAICPSVCPLRHLGAHLCVGQASVQLFAHMSSSHV